jgi:EmrB/QacA subfamily drug resistance transporter
MNQISNNPGNSYKWWVLVSVAIANLSAALDMSIVTVSFPRLTEVFHTDASVIVWLTISFAVAELGLMLTLAKLGDTIGRKKVYCFGVAFYTLGLILCSISPNISMLIFSRAVQGAGAAIIATIGSAIIVAAFPAEQQGRAIGMFAMLTSIGLIAGPALGGVLIDVLDWQGLFYPRIPVGIITLILGLVVIREQKIPGARLRLDYGGALTLLLSTGCLLLYFNLGSDWGYVSISALLLLAVSVVCFVAFFLIERRVSEPVLDMTFFKNRTFTMASLTAFVQMMAGSQGPMLFPFFIVDGLLLSTSTAGLLMAIIAIPPVIISPLSGWISDKVGHRLPMVTATVCFTAALFLASRLNLDTTVLHIVLVMGLFGIGMGMFMAPNQSAIISTVSRRHLATAMGVANTVRLLGGAAGMALGGTLYAVKQAERAAVLALQDVPPDMVVRLSVAESFEFGILLAAFICTISIVTALFIRKTQQDAVIE